MTRKLLFCAAFGVLASKAGSAQDTWSGTLCGSGDFDNVWEAAPGTDEDDVDLDATNPANASWNIYTWVRRRSGGQWVWSRALCTEPGDTNNSNNWDCVREIHVSGPTYDPNPGEDPPGTAGSSDYSGGWD